MTDCILLALIFELDGLGCRGNVEGQLQLVLGGNQEGSAGAVVGHYNHLVEIDLPVGLNTILLGEGFVGFLGLKEGTHLDSRTDGLVGGDGQNLLVAGFDEVQIEKGDDYKLSLKLNIYDKDDYHIENNDVYYLYLLLCT